MNQNNVQPAGEAASQPARVSKISQVVALLRRPEGATAAQIMEATGWQAHSVRGAIAGQIRKIWDDGKAKFEAANGRPADPAQFAMTFVDRNFGRS